MSESKNGIELKCVACVVFSIRRNISRTVR